MLQGPIEYVPPATVEVLLRRQSIPLDENEGIYVRDIKTGKVSALSCLDRIECVCSKSIYRSEFTPTDSL